MSYPAIQVANELIARHGASGNIDPMKLQKLLYFANGWWLALVGRPLITEAPQVWRYGPVFKPIYHTFSKYGRNNIRQPEPATPFGGDPLRIPQDAADTQEVQHLLDWIMGEYGWKSGAALSDDTHRPGTPWRKIAERKKFQVPENEVIPPQEDWQYFSELARARGYQPVPIAAA